MAKKEEAKSGAKKTTTSKKKANQKPNTHMVHKIDATNQALGRLASQIAIILRGKNKPTFQPHLDKGDSVLVTNVTKLKITGKKLEQKMYYHYSGYPGGLKTKQLKDVYAKNPAWVLKTAVWNMLPKNKLRAQMIKRLKINN